MINITRMKIETLARLARDNHELGNQSILTGRNGRRGTPLQAVRRQLHETGVPVAVGDRDQGEKFLRSSRLNGVAGSAGMQIANLR